MEDALSGIESQHVVTAQGSSSPATAQLSRQPSSSMADVAAAATAGAAAAAATDKVTGAGAGSGAGTEAAVDEPQPVVGHQAGGATSLGMSTDRAVSWLEAVDQSGHVVNESEMDDREEEVHAVQVAGAPEQATEQGLSPAGAPRAAGATQ